VDKTDALENGVKDTAATDKVKSATGGKKPWVTPAATFEQVSEVTKITGGGVNDGGTCHS
jgi:hypothetical protein